MSEHRWKTPPNSPERMEEINEWMGREFRAAADELILAVYETVEEARALSEGIRLIEEAFEEEP